MGTTTSQTDPVQANSSCATPHRLMGLAMPHCLCAAYRDRTGGAAGSEQKQNFD